MGVHLRVYNNNLLRQAPLHLSMPTTWITVWQTRTKASEGTESADNKVAKVEGAQGHDKGIKGR